MYGCARATGAWPSGRRSWADARPRPPVQAGARRELKFLRTRLGRVIRDIRRKIAGNPRLTERFADLLALAVRARFVAREIAPSRVRGPHLLPERRLHSKTVRLLGRPRGRRVSGCSPRSRVGLRRRVRLCAARDALLVSVLLGDRITVDVDTVCSCGRRRRTGVGNRSRRDGRCRRRARRRRWRNSGDRRRQWWRRCGRIGLRERGARHQNDRSHTGQEMLRHWCSFTCCGMCVNYRSLRWVPPQPRSSGGCDRRCRALASTKLWHCCGLLPVRALTWRSMAT
jgi:hypothetical protein